MTIDQYLEKRRELDQQLREAEALPINEREKVITNVRARILLLKIELNSAY